MRLWVALLFVMGATAAHASAQALAAGSDSDWAKKSDKFWKQKLTSDQFKVCRKGGTEMAFTGKYDVWKDQGVFTCSSCGLPLFDSNTKFDSGTGWPSFYEPIAEDAISEHEDNSFFMRRVEVKCSRCDAHLGHVFNDGPKPTGLRYCINSVCLDFDPADLKEDEAKKPKKGATE